MTLLQQPENRADSFDTVDCEDQRAELFCLTHKYLSAPLKRMFYVYSIHLFIRFVKCREAFTSFLFWQKKKIN